MYTAGDQCSDDNPNESRRSPHRAGHRPKYGTQTSNVKELDEKRLPPRQWYVIHTVGHRNRRRGTGTIDDKNSFANYSIAIVPYDQNRHTCKKSNHPELNW